MLRFLRSTSFLLLMFTLLGSSMMQSLAVAQPRSTSATKSRRYVPPKRRPTPRRTEAGGTRGCAANQPAAQVTLLIPPQDVAHTRRRHPTFSWHVANPAQADVPVTFALIEPGQTEPIYRQEFRNQQSGIMQVQLPAALPGLQPDRPYRWIVSVNCADNSASEQIFQRAWVEYVPMTTPEEKNLTQAKTLADQVIADAENGFWYEAIDQAATHQTDITIQPLWQSLLEEGELDRILTPPPQVPSVPPSPSQR
jgi:hypothetical protein